MNVGEILHLIGEAVEVLPQLVETGVDIKDRVDKIKKLADAAKDGTATRAMVQEVRDQLDADLDEFNSPLPD
jgi:flagellar biosynthesis component FlhA